MSSWLVIHLEKALYHLPILLKPFLFTCVM
jgi:hypothetical protein